MEQFPVFNVRPYTVKNALISSVPTSVTLVTASQSWW
jgi:hypothetical protein